MRNLNVSTFPAHHAPMEQHNTTPAPNSATCMPGKRSIKGKKEVTVEARKGGHSITRGPSHSRGSTRGSRLKGKDMARKRKNRRGNEKTEKERGAGGYGPNSSSLHATHAWRGDGPDQLAERGGYTPPGHRPL